MTDSPSSRPLGLADVFPLDLRPSSNYWLWCRAHTRAHKSGQQCNQELARVGVNSCIDIGPFMSLREANILARFGQGYAGEMKPLDMKVES